jgi:hypothetical protein
MTSRILLKAFQSHDPFKLFTLFLPRKSLSTSSSWEVPSAGLE